MVEGLVVVVGFIDGAVEDAVDGAEEGAVEGAEDGMNVGMNVGRSVAGDTVGDPSGMGASDGTNVTGPKVGMEVATVGIEVMGVMEGMEVMGMEVMGAMEGIKVVGMEGSAVMGGRVAAGPGSMVGTVTVEQIAHQLLPGIPRRPRLGSIPLSQSVPMNISKTLANVPGVA